MNQDENDDLWHLLGKARTPAVSPFFSRNVLREIRAERQEQPGLVTWLLRRWRLGAVSACVLAVVGIGAWQQIERPPTIAELAQKVSASPDYAVINHLDELLASEETSVWLEHPRF